MVLKMWSTDQQQQYHPETFVKNAETLTHICGICKKDTDEPICRAGMETQTQRTDLWTQWVKRKVGRIERLALTYILYWASLVGSEIKNPASAGDPGEASLIPGLGRSLGGGNGSRLKYSCLENPHGQKSLVGYSP